VLSGLASSSLRIYCERDLSFLGPVGYNITLGGATFSTSKSDLRPVSLGKVFPN
jgi:hypothetical protein